MCLIINWSIRKCFGTFQNSWIPWNLPFTFIHAQVGNKFFVINLAISKSVFWFHMAWQKKIYCLIVNYGRKCWGTKGWTKVRFNLIIYIFSYNVSNYIVFCIIYIAFWSLKRYYVDSFMCELFTYIYFLSINLIEHIRDCYMTSESLFPLTNIS